MGHKADLRRRWVGAAFLAAALAMLIAGQTVFERKLSGMGLLLYWLLCFAFTGMAVLVAFLDYAVTRQRLRDEQRTLLEDTLKEIAREKEARSKQRPPGNRR
jgi:uncharacterized membrane protein YhaH (DUF805 family)